MKMLLAFLISFTFATSAYAENKATWFEEDMFFDPHELEQKATQVLHFYDPQGVVWVENQTGPLPARPDSKEKLIQSVEVITNQKQKFKILVFTTLEKIPPEFLKTLRTAIRTPIDISKVIPIPQQALPPAAAQLAANPLARNPSAVPEPSTAVPGATKGELSDAPVVRPDQLLSEEVLQGMQNWLPLLFALLTLLGIAAIGWILKAVANGISRIPGALSSLNAQANYSGEFVANAGRLGAVVDAKSGGVSSPSAAKFDLDLQATLSLFTDLIRNGKLPELKYYWEQTSFSLKREILTHLSKHKIIFQQLTLIPPAESMIHLDPTYLTASFLDVDLDSEMVAGKVKADPGHFLNLSSLQRDNLKLPILDRLQLFEQYEKNLGETKIFLTAEEEAVLAEQSTWSSFWVRSCVSMVALRALPEASAMKVLNTQNAMNLAKIWTFPKSVEVLLQKLIPVDKMNLVQFYLSRQESKISKSLQLQILSAIHAEIVREYKNNARSTPQSSSQSNAA